MLSVGGAGGWNRAREEGGREREGEKGRGEREKKCVVK